MPEGFPLHQILNRSPSPTPRPALEAIWQLVAHANADLLAFKPIIARAFGQGAERDTATWVRAALGSGQWAQIARRGERTVAPVLLAQPVESASLLRVGAILPALREREAVEVEAWTWGAEGKLARRELAPSCVWRVAGSGGAGAGAEIAGYDVPLAPGDRGVLFGVSGALGGVCLNVALAANTPAVRDGRLWTVQRNVPEPVSLLFQDLVTPEVVQHTLEQPVPAETAARLSALPLAHFSVEDLDGGKGIIRDLRGVAVDPTEGRLTLNAPDSRGEERTLRLELKLLADVGLAAGCGWTGTGARTARSAGSGRAPSLR